MTPRDDIRHDWTVEEIRAIHDGPLMDLVFRAATIHRRYNDPADIQRASLLSIKTGGCPEDCGYCSQSAHHKETGLARQRLMPVETVLNEAAAAKAAGATRFCMGAAWRQPKDGPEFDAVLSMVRGVRSLGMEACVTLGMLTDSQAGRLAEAGLTAYNHNLDTGPATTTRSSRPGPTRTGWRPWTGCARPASACAAAASSGSARRSTTGRRCCTSSPTTPPTRRACRSTRWPPSRAPRSATRPRRSIPSRWCACAPPPAL